MFKKNYYFKRSTVFGGEILHTKKMQSIRASPTKQMDFCKYFGGKKDGYNRPGYSSENSICECWLLDGKYLASEQPLKIISCFQKEGKNKLTIKRLMVSSLLLFQSWLNMHQEICFK